MLCIQVEKCFYDIEEDVEMHIMKKKDGYTKTESHDQSLHFLL